ncbi:MAG: AmmeMemoRadiSam system protein A [Thermovirgaceae bacterium]|jgi:hypothetical protein|nr:AmmeMemoRadiSam system protein A [Synergistales bacterium]MDI9391981.1 AmmeMemoRadiSam system protein A [Synergistota bacterium]MDY0178332.1 AmmeMemoRadiSam system protein A [Synergistaceae bacterium]HRW87485.1 AmmeMemoRadiSam system protein A [Thermovirgaceae bacterium]MDD3134200.1 AmmeMemoRadiSam system protein A [Synergistales bacterium]
MDGLARSVKGEAHPYLDLARRAVRLTALGQDPFRHLDPREYNATTEMLIERGCFVSIRMASTGELRGCIGTIRPVRKSLWEEIVANAAAAASEDPRFFPLGPDEAEECRVSVDVLDEPCPVGDLSELDPLLFGVIVEKEGRKGVLLPDLDGVDTVEQQLSIAMRKAGIGSSDGVRIFRFTVRRFSE